MNKRRRQSFWVRTSIAPRFLMILLLTLLLFLPSLSQKVPTTNSNSSKNKNSGQANSKRSSKRGASEGTLKEVPPPPVTPLEFELISLNSDGTRKKDGVEKRQVNHFVEKVGSAAFDMIEIPAGQFKMGLPPAERTELVVNCQKYCSGEACKACEEIARSEAPQHEVTVQKKFYMSRTEITQSQWDAVRELSKTALVANPSDSRSDPTYDSQRPVERVSWADAKEFCKVLSRQTGRTYRLPTEAEWEYSCRAGTQTAFAFGPTIYGEDFNYNGYKPYGAASSAPAIYKTTVWVTLDRLALANAFGLYHLHGNVAEWCEDSWHNSYEGAPGNSSAWLEQGSRLRVARGGSWNDPGYACRCSARQKYTETFREPYLGFRIVMEPREPSPAPKKR